MSPDADLLNKLYYKYPNREEMFVEMYKLVRKVAESPLPVMDKATQDKLVFFGLENEKEFISKIKKDLFTRIERKITELKVGNTQKLKEFMNLAELSDMLRKEKRATGESYFCHYLGAAWLLWTMIENEIGDDPEALLAAIEDVELTMVHDVPEDLPHEMMKPFEEEAFDYKRETFPLSITIEGEKLTVQLSRNQWLILNAITKETGDNGSIWLQKIQTVRDKRDQDPTLAQIHASRLRKRAARCKAPDRISNIFTMLAKADSYIDALRKLEETSLSGGQLLWLTYFGDRVSISQYQKLREMLDTNSFITLIAAIPIIAEIEKRIVMGKFAQAVWEEIKSTDATWARHLTRVVEEEIIYRRGENTRERVARPLWYHRLNTLMHCYLISARDSDLFIPLIELEKYFGLEHFAKNAPFGPQEPLEFRHVLAKVRKDQRFFTNYTPYRGVLGTDDVYAPNLLSSPVFDFIWYDEEATRIRQELRSATRRDSTGEFTPVPPAPRRRSNIMERARTIYRGGKRVYGGGKELYRKIKSRR